MAQVTLSRPLEHLPALSPPDQRARRKRILRELALLAVLLGVYHLGRLISAQHAGAAFENAMR